MTGSVHEPVAVFQERDHRSTLVGTAFEGLKRFRTFGACGPMYEVIRIDGEQALVWLSNSDEEVTLPMASLLDDPQAE